MVGYLSSLSMLTRVIKNKFKLPTLKLYKNWQRPLGISIHFNSTLVATANKKVYFKLN